MKRRRISGVSSKGLQNTLVNDVLPVAGGYVLGNMVLDKVLEKASPDMAKYGRWLKLGLGAFLASTQKGMVSRAGLGLAVAGVAEVAADSVSGVNLLAPGRSSYFMSGQDTPGPIEAGNVKIKVQ